MKFKETHEWVDVKGDEALVGISMYAQKELGDIVYIELPRLGAKIKVGDEIAVLESTKSAVDIYSPLSGEIIEVNTQLKEFPSKINSSPEKEGWICKIKIENLKELDHFLDEKVYRTLIEG
jgi:glycine cleavage system H protein